MINTINHIPAQISIDKLNKYEKNEEIIQQLSHLEIPFLDEPIMELENNDTFICESDLVLFSTSNNLEESFLQFHIYDKEHDDFIINHDIFLFSSINDSEYIYKNNKHYIALATCEKDIMLYDSLVFNPLTPQLLLKGHDDSVLAVKFFNNALYSGSDDKKILEWDLETLRIKESFTTNLNVEKIANAGNMIFYGEKNTIANLSTGTNFFIDGNLENMVGHENFLYLTTSSGSFYTYDSRNTCKPFFEHKYSEEPLTGLHFLNDKIGMCSKKGEIWVLDSKDFEIKNTENIKSTLFSIKLHESNVIFYGDEGDSLQMKKMRNVIF
ncbi:WD40 repeat domain-containing protein [Vairimorpha necatrix]|uniref:WD40 repeat domain-containing protein n=1 Tax=Vairimorpha necatrix TaxID=6039 RepID=A0AAX4J8W9_9MICR